MHQQEEEAQAADRYDPLLWSAPSFDWIRVDVSIPGDIVGVLNGPHGQELWIRTRRVRPEWVPLRNALIMGVTGIPRGEPTTIIYEDTLYGIGEVRQGPEGYIDYRLEPWPDDAPLTRTYAYSRQAELVRLAASRRATGPVARVVDAAVGFLTAWIFGHAGERVYVPRYSDFYALFRNACLLQATAGAAALLTSLVWGFDWFAATAGESDVVVPLKPFIAAGIGLLCTAEAAWRWHRFAATGKAPGLLLIGSLLAGG